MENWEKAAEHATSVFSTPGSNLALYDMTPIDYPAAISLGGFPYPFTLNNSEIIFYYASENEYQIVKAEYTTECFMASDALRNCFADDDQRWNGYLCPYNEERDQKKLSKFSNQLEFGACLRLSEVYLNRAEAYAQMAKAGQNEYFAKAVSDLNSIREKRIKNYSTQAWDQQHVHNNAENLIERVERTSPGNFVSKVCAGLICDATG